MSNRKEDGGALLAGMALGLISGAIIMLLYAPKNGRELREDLKEKANEIPLEFTNLLHDLKGFYAKSVDLLTTLAKEQCGKVKEAVDETGKVIKEKMVEPKNSSHE